MINPNFLHLILLPFAPFMRMKFAGSFCPLHPLKGKLIEIHNFFKPSSNVLRKRTLLLSKKKKQRNKTHRYLLIWKTYQQGKKHRELHKMNSGRKFVVLVLSAEGLKELQRV